MEDPTDIGMKNARWLDIWFSIGLVEVLDTLVSRHHLMPKFKYIDFFFFFFTNKVYRFDFSPTMYINSQILIE